MKQEEGMTYGYGFWYLLNVLVCNIFLDRDTSHLKDSKTIEDYQGTAPTPTGLETGSDAVEEEICTRFCRHCMSVHFFRAVCESFASRLS